MPAFYIWTDPKEGQWMELLSFAKAQPLRTCSSAELSKTWDTTAASGDVGRAEVSVGFSITEEGFPGHCFWVWAPPRLGAHIWIWFLLALVSTELDSPCAAPVLTKQHWGTPGLPRSAALQGVHGSVAPISGTGTFYSSEKVLNAT